MKKKRTCTDTLSYSPKNSPRPLRAQSIPIKSKSHYELKRRRQLRANAKQKHLDHVDNICIKKEVFDSLESLFDLKKPLSLPETNSSAKSYHSETDKYFNLASEYLSLSSPRFLDLSLLFTRSTNAAKLEPHIIVQNELSAFASNENAKKTEGLQEILENEFLLRSSGPSQNSFLANSNFVRKMADDENAKVTEDAAPEEIPKDAEKPETDEVSKDAEKPENGEVLKDTEKPDIDKVAKDAEKPETGALPKDAEKPEAGVQKDAEKSETEGISKNDEKREAGKVPEDAEKSKTEDVPKDAEKSKTEEIPKDTQKPKTGKVAEDAEKLGTEQSEVAKKSDKKKVPEKDEKIDSKESEAQPPQHKVPSKMGEGIPIKPGENRDSIMDAIPLTDSAVMKEMNDAYERCVTIGEEIEQLKKEMKDLVDKTDLSQEDTALLSEKQENVNTKLAELDEMTRKIQRLIGLSDPSSYTFATMFGMLPYPHQKKPDDDTSSEGDESFERDDDFDIPQTEYPEDKLPRVIICGNTEDCIPKIVVADSKRKRPATKHLTSLTGKLSDSLIMQEKLVQENAKLEGGKYRLEEAILEKDNAVDNLQRKVCGLQAEMRIIVKENTQLSRQLANLNQKVASPSCCYSCPGGAPSSPLSTPALPTYSYSTNWDDHSCSCKFNLQDNIGDSVALTSGNSDNCKCRTVSGSPRLSGGGVQENPFSPERKTFRGNMSCVTPAVANTCGSPRPPSRGICPAELENMYGQNTKHLEEQLGNIESEVRTMQMELMNVQRERNQLDQQRKLFKCTGPCAPCPCPTTGAILEPVPRSFQSSNVCPCPQSGVNTLLPMKINLSQVSQGSCLSGPVNGSPCNQQQLRDLKEQYARLQDDYKSKLCEVSCLRSDAEKMKQETRCAKEERAKMENKLIDLQERLKILEIEKNKMNGSKEQLIEQEQALIVAKQRFRDAQDELEELRSLTQDQSAQLEDYRNKYLMAQQKVEEQRHQLDLMELDNARMNENVTLEIGRVKNQFQEKLAELAPLPDILKQTQLKLQESQQMRQIAERNCEELSRELLDCKDKIQAVQKEMDILRSENIALQGDCGQGSGRCDELERKNSELRTENDRLKNTLIRIEEQEAQLQKRIDEKLHEVAQLTALLEQVREDSARQVARTKERCEMVRKTMQCQISEMERQLAQCRATARAAQKDRDEIRQKMQGQINNLNEAFDHAQGRIKSLQGHVNYLKTSYSNIFCGQGQGESPVPCISGESPLQGQGYDSCDCNY